MKEQSFIDQLLKARFVKVSNLNNGSYTNWGELSKKVCRKIPGDIYELKIPMSVIGILCKIILLRQNDISELNSKQIIFRVKRGKKIKDAIIKLELAI